MRGAGATQRVFVATALVLLAASLALCPRALPTAGVAPAARRRPAAPSDRRVVRPVSAPKRGPDAEPWHDQLRRLDALLRRAPGRDEASVAEQARLLAELQAQFRAGDPARILGTLGAAEIDSPFGLWAIRRWLARDPAAAADWLVRCPHATDDQAWLLANAVAAEPTRFAGVCARLPPTPWAEQFLAHLASAVATRAPTLAVVLAAELPDGAGRDQLVETVAQRWIRTDPVAAVAWLETIPRAETRRRAVVAAAQIAAIDDPPAGAGLLDAIRDSEGAVWSEAALRVVARWAADDPAQAAAWVRSWPASPVRDAASRIVAAPRPGETYQVAAAGNSE